LDEFVLKPRMRNFSSAYILVLLKKAFAFYCGTEVPHTYYLVSVYFFCGKR